MKKLLALIAVVTLFAIGGCSTKFKIAAPYKNITVIWGLLDQSDTAHYIRIEKAFLSNTLSSVTMAQNPDSNYFPNLNVYMEMINMAPYGGVYATIPLYRVNLDSEGYPKQPGVFFNSPNYAYKFTNQLNPNYSYRLVVSNPVTGEVDSAETPVIVDNNPTVFTVPQIDIFNLNHAGLQFTSIVISNLDEINFYGTYNAPAGYSFYGQSSPVYVSDFILGFNWVDSNISTNAKVNRSASDDLGFQVLNSTNSFQYTLNNIDMYGDIAGALGKAPASTERLLSSCTLTAYMATPDYYTYLQNAGSQGIGLTGNEIEPIYTNIKGANVLGLFTSKGVRTGNIGIFFVTVDSLAASPILNGTNLVGQEY